MRGLEPPTLTLARLRSTPELHPRFQNSKTNPRLLQGGFLSFLKKFTKNDDNFLFMCESSKKEF